MPAKPQPHRASSLVVRIVVAAAVIGAVVWYLASRHHAHEPNAAEKEAQHAQMAANGGAAASEGHTRGSGEAGAGAERGEDGGGGGGGKHGGGGGGSGSGERVVPVQVAVAQKQDVPVWLEGMGSVDALYKVTVHAQVDGRLDSVLFTEGQLVKQGDVIAQIDPRPFRVQLLSAQGALARDKAQLDENIINLKRYQDLQGQQLVAAQTTEQYKFQAAQYEGAVKIDQAQIAQAELQLDYAAIKAPLTGITGVRLVDPGNIIHATDTAGLVVITSIDPAAVYFTVPQDQLEGVAMALSKGEVPVQVWTHDGATQLGTGTLMVLDNQVNQTTATLRLKAKIDNPKHILWPNAFVKARMLLETRKDALVVPSVAIQQGPQGAFVYTVDADRVVHSVPVTVALQTGEVTIVGKGLAGGEQVVTEGQQQLRPGGHVSISKAGGPGGDGSGAQAADAAGSGAAGSGAVGATGATGAAGSGAGSANASGEHDRHGMHGKGSATP